MEQFTLAALTKFGLDDLRVISVPMAPGVHLRKAKAEEQPKMDVTEYKKHIGVLMYLSGRTRPDIAFPVMQLSRFSEHPTEAHVAVLQQVWRYLACTADKGLVFRRSKEGLQPVFMVDADYGNDFDTGKSVTGFVGLIAGAPFVYKSKLQGVVAQSTCEAEYMALCAASNEASWSRMYLDELGFLTKTVTVHADNQSAIAMGKKPVLNQRTKHILTKYHVVRDYIRKKVVKPVYVKSENNTADIMTKALAKVAFCKHREMLVKSD